MTLHVLPLLLMVLLAAASEVAAAPDDWSPDGRAEAEAVVSADLDAVWNAWTTDAGVRSFFCADSKVELRPGGPYEIYIVPDAEPGSRGSEGCTILSYEPRSMLSFTWTAPPSFEHARRHTTWVVLRLEALDPNHTRVRLTHLGFDRMAAEHPDHAAEWHVAEQYFERAWPVVLGWLNTALGPGATDGAGVVATLDRMVGSWSHDAMMPGGTPFRVWNRIERGASPGRFIGRGWQDRGDGWVRHSDTQVWLDETTGLVHFRDLGEGGGVSRGTITLDTDGRLVWHWCRPGDAPDRPSLRLVMEVDGDGAGYTLHMHALDPDLPVPPEPVRFRPVDPDSGPAS